MTRDTSRTHGIRKWEQIHQINLILQLNSKNSPKPEATHSTRTRAHTHPCAYKVASAALIHLRLRGIRCGKIDSGSQVRERSRTVGSSSEQRTIKSPVSRWLKWMTHGSMRYDVNFFCSSLTILGMLYTVYRSPRFVSSCLPRSSSEWPGSSAIWSRCRCLLVGTTEDLPDLVGCSFPARLSHRSLLESTR